MNCAVFLDRDGVINHNWLNPGTGEWESPIRPEDLHFIAGALEALLRLRALGFKLFLVSNQPSAAKGKCSLADLAGVHSHFQALLEAAGIRFEAFYYAYGHPDAVVPALAGPTPDRKPSPYFINQALERYGLSRAECWMIGDRDIDIECGHRAGLRTIQVVGSEPDSKAGAATPNFAAPSLAAAVSIIAAETQPPVKG